MSEIDHEYTKEIVCPYCGNEESDSWEFSESGEHECSVCDNEFTYERNITVEYSTAKKECETHDLVLRKDMQKFIYDSESVFKPTYRREPIPESDWRYYKLMCCSICDKEVQVQISIDEYNLI